MISMTLTFYDPAVAKLFETYCVSHQPASQKKWYNQEERAFVYQNEFNTSTEKSKFISGWANLSMKRE